MKKKLDHLYVLISEGNNRIGEQSTERAILIMGETGAGKTTLANLFAGKQMKADLSKAGKMIVDTSDGSGGIGHKPASETKIPTKIKSESGELILWDCPGFADTENIQDIANAFYIQRLFETTKELKFVLTIPEYSLQNPRGTELLRVVGHFTKIFKDISKIKDSVSLVITQADHNRSPENTRFFLEDILEHNKEIEPKNKEMLGYLTKSIEIFPRPIKIGILEKMLSLATSYVSKAQENPILASIESSTEYFKANSQVANVVISESSRALADELFSESNSSLLKLLQDVSQEISGICNQVNSKGNQINNGIIHSVGAFLGSLVSRQELENIKEQNYKELLNLNSLLAFRAFCDLMINKKGDVQEWLKSLHDKVSDVASVLGRYDGKEPRASELKDQIKEKIKYVQFLSKVQEGVKDSKHVKQDDFIVTFEQCKNSVEEAAKKGVESISLDSEEKIEYYEAAIRFLEPYSHCKANTALAYAYIAKIQEEEKKFDLAIESAQKSIELNADTKDNLVKRIAYTVIDRVCSLHNDKLLKLTCQYKVNVLEALFNKNKLAFDAELAKVMGHVRAFLKKVSDNQNNTDKAVFTSLMDEALLIQKSTLFRMNHISSSMSKFGNELVKILVITGAKSNKTKVALKYLDALNKQAGGVFSRKLDEWLKYFDLKKLESELVTIVKGLRLVGGDVSYYTKVIEYTTLMIPSGELEQRMVFKDPVCIAKRAEAHYEIGKIKQGDKKYDEALKKYAEAISLAESLEDAYRKIDEIYFAQDVKDLSAITDQKILTKLLSFNTSVLKEMLSRKLIKYIDDYKTNKKYFTKHHDQQGLKFDDLDNLDNLASLLKIVEAIFSYNIVSNYSGFKKNLSEIASILNRNFVVSASDFGKKSICEQKTNLPNVTKDQPKDVFGIGFLYEQIDYIESLQTKLYSALKPFSLISLRFFPNGAVADIDKLAEGFNLDSMKDTMLRAVQSIEFDYKDEIGDFYENTYYERVIEHAVKYPNDKICVKLIAHANLCLARLAEDINTKITYYEAAIKANDELSKLCKGSDNSFYAKNSIQRISCEELGDVYAGLSEFKKAIEEYSKVDIHIKIKSCFEELLDQYENDYQIREQRADYFNSKGIIDSAIDSYHDALSLTIDPDVHERIGKKISTTLVSSQIKATEFNKRASEVGDTRIVYLLDEVEYDNPLLNTQMSSRYSPTDFGRLLSLSEQMVRSGNGSLVSHLLNSCEEQELLTMFELLAGSSSLLE